jgi:hypothetical protein
MSMKNPPHPGDLIRTEVVEALGRGRGHPELCDLAGRPRAANLQANAPDATDAPCPRLRVIFPKLRNGRSSG